MAATVIGRFQLPDSRLGVLKLPPGVVGSALQQRCSITSATFQCWQWTVFEHPIPGTGNRPLRRRLGVIVLGVILILLALLFDISVLYTIGIVLVVVGAILWILGALGRQIGPRGHYW
jgi:hypothetical protein